MNQEIYVGVMALVRLPAGTLQDDVAIALVEA